ERLVKKGARVLVETGIGSTIYFTDDDYKKAGAEVTSRADILSSADITLRVRKPPLKEVNRLKEGSIHISFLDPFDETQLVQELANRKISTISMGMIPRTTLAQKMDALTSQANLAGYVAVILAVQRMHKILPMMISPAGTIPPARVFIVGAGVAGLQAIATAKRLGARVEAFDTRPIVKEEVESLGAKFVKIKQIETGQDKDGYAKALTPEQIEQQRQGMRKICSHTDILITTAQLFGRKAPVIITKDMIDEMKPGSVIVDMAVESGGNVEGSKLEEEVKTDNEIRIIGFGNLPSRVCAHASLMYSNNLTNFVEMFWNDEEKKFNLNTEDEIIKGCLVTHGGQIVHDLLKKKE
ncbi:MAG: NAD(P) transhydrogenase subunit alpha, partial [Candidatus Omnitrophica bacterium]|nr:NAD(P) transhydrogenase subunit alpha [Candidatus Omnitrophota bacterium]